MAPEPKCAAISAAQKRAGLSYADIATKIGSTEGRVTQIVTGAVAPTEAEFKALSAALDIADVPHSGVHQTA
ncbi:hypothetical protein FA13DRAFT_1733322 [Coprinellus micaceus]|uniref:HTH cro/C1-type domain-containing protein n=1 Tax=Coprinellus micaceus TaxID=71717 RepID=A0A4Y7T9W6_COPMI|nr:hypothetical protein FA13DRAFT_1733322 [Coprinellus micaceus]